MQESIIEQLHDQAEEFLENLGDPDTFLGEQENEGRLYVLLELWYKNGCHRRTQTAGEREFIDILHATTAVTSHHEVLNAMKEAYLRGVADHVYTIQSYFRQNEASVATE